MPRPPEQRLLTEANANKTFVRFVDTNGDPIVGTIVTIVVDTANNEIADIITEGGN